MEEHKVCTACKVDKPASHFFLRKRRSGNGKRLNSICRMCNGKRIYNYRQRKLNEQEFSAVKEFAQVFPTLTTVPGTPERIAVYRVRASRGGPVLCEGDAESRDDPRYVKVNV